MTGNITLGHTLRSVRVGDATLTETAHRPRMELPRHEHARANVTFVLSGGFVERIGARELDGRPGVALVKPGGASHSNRYGAAGSRCLVVEMPSTDAWRRRSRHGDAGRCLARRGRSGLRVGWRLYRELLRPDAVTPLAVEGLLLELGDRLRPRAACACDSASAPPWLRRARARLDGESAPTMGELAAEAGVHPRHLMRAFRRWIGCSIGEYARRLRIRRARAMLAQTSAGLAAVSLATGFYDQSHFARTFKRLTGLTPREYRQLARSLGASDATG